MKVTSKVFQRVRRFFRRDSGGTLAELAILVPFLAIMLAAVAEFGRLFQTYTTLTKATRSAARYLSNHKFDNDSKDKARDLVVCGKLKCAAGDQPLVTGMSAAKVCIESTGSPSIETVTVRIPRPLEGGGCGAPHLYNPVFDIGKLLHLQAYSLNVPLSPSTTMRYVLDN